MDIPDLVPTLNPSLGWEPMEDGCLIYSADGSQILTLNALAELIVSYCDGSTPLRAIYEQVIGDAAIEPAAFMEAVNVLLRERVLLELTSP